MLQGIQFSSSAVADIANKDNGLHKLAVQVVEDGRAKHDFHAKSNTLRYVTEGGKTMLAAHDMGAFEVNDNMHRQVRTHLGVDHRYYERIRNERTTVVIDGAEVEKSLLDLNINHWLNKSDETRLIRTKGTVARAFLSNRYRPLDNEDLLEAIIPTLLEMGNGLEVASCQVTDAKLYLKLVSRNRWFEVGVGSTVYGGVIITNDECGNGSMAATPFSVVKECDNGMTHTDFGTRRNHVGSRIDIGDRTSAVFSDETFRADDKAYWLKFRDIVKAALSDDMLKQIVEQMRAAKGITVENPMAALDVVAKNYRLNDKEKLTALENLLSGAHGAGKNNLWGISNAVTFAAGQSDDYDRASELEEIGGNILNLQAVGGSALKELVTAGSK